MAFFLINDRWIAEDIGYVMIGGGIAGLVATLLLFHLFNAALMMLVLGAGWRSRAEGRFLLLTLTASSVNLRLVKVGVRGRRPLHQCVQLVSGFQRGIQAHIACVAY